MREVQSSISKQVNRTMLKLCHRKNFDSRRNDSKMSQPSYITFECDSTNRTKFSFSYKNKLKTSTCGNLVAQSSASTMNHNAHLSLSIDSHLLSGMLVVNIIYYLDFSVMVTSPERAQLKSMVSVNQIVFKKYEFG